MNNNENNIFDDDSNLNPVDMDEANADVELDIPGSSDSDVGDVEVRSTSELESLDDANESSTGDKSFSNETIMQDKINQNDDYLNSNFQSSYNNYPYAQSPVVNEDCNIPPVIYSNIIVDKEKKSPNTGLRIFCMLMALVVLISAAALGGYYAGKSNNTNASAFVPQGLEQKPTDNSIKSLEEIYNNVSKSVVSITIYNEKGSGIATGVIYTEDGYVITNDHIYSEITGARFMVCTNDGKEYPAKYVAGDSKSDIAILKIDGSGFSPATLGNSNELLFGESVAAIGCPGEYGNPPVITNGIVSSTGIRVTTSSAYATKFIQVDAAINPGSSGGALVNMYGQVVGITSAKLAGTSYDLVSYAIPTITAKPVVDSLILNGYMVDRAKLGITYQFLSTVAAEVASKESGLIIASISEESGLYGTSAVVGDVITHINGNKIVRADIVLDIIEAAKPGDSLELTISTQNGGSYTINSALVAAESTSSYKLVDDPASSSSQSSDFNFPFGD